MAIIDSDIPSADGTSHHLRTADFAAATTALGIGIALFACAAATSLFSDVDPELPLTLGFLSALALFSAGIIWLYYRSFQNKLRQIEDGKFHLHWRYDEATWTRYQEKFARQQTRSLWITVLILLPSGVVFSVARHNDDALIGDSVFWTFILCCGAAAVAALRVFVHRCCPVWT